MFFYFIPIRKKVVIQNLQKAFPNYSDKKIKKIAFNTYNSFAIVLIEILSIPKLDSKTICSLIKFENIDLVKEKYKSGNGLILMTAHFANWEWMALAMGLQLNIPINVIVKNQQNSFVNSWLNNARTKWNNKVIPLGASIKNVFVQLKKGNIVAMVADQRGPKYGNRVNFFDIPTCVFDGPATLALRTNAPLLIGFAVRQKDFSYNVTMYEIDLDNLPENDEEKIREINQRHMKKLEEYISNYPEQWLWMHKIWKY
ncbi:MAG: lysophospholipid acyltransferase family protein [Ignavibacterium sp.]